MAFIQIIEFTTASIDDVEALVSEWESQTAGRRTAQRATFTQDRDRANTYVQIVEFPSFNDAMANSDLPETASFAERLCSVVRWANRLSQLGRSPRRRDVTGAN